VSSSYTASTSASSVSNYSFSGYCSDHALSPHSATDYLIYKESNSWSKFQSL